MSELIIIAHADLVGDSIAMLPAIQELRRRWDGDVYLHMPNRWVRDLIPASYGFKDLFALPLGSSKAKVMRSSPWDACDAYIRTLHMTQAHFAIFGLPVPSEPVRAEIEVDDTAPVFDYVLSPWSRSDIDHNKAWWDDRWAKVVDALDGSIAVVGGIEDPQPWLAHYEYGKDLRYVAGLLRNARKAVITIDNGMSHLAFHAGCTKHVLLYPECLPPWWVGNPKALAGIIRQPKHLTPEAVLALVPR